MIKDKIEIISRTSIDDHRGSFVKVMTGFENELNGAFGEIYIVKCLPGQIRGGHYHILATEWFTVLSGKANLELADPFTGEKKTIELDSCNPQTVKVQPYTVHQFRNLTQGEFILLAYSSIKYDPLDTIIFPFDNGN